MKIAIFDFDGTLFTQETIPFLLKQYGKIGYSKWIQTRVFVRLIILLLRYKLTKKMDKEAFRGQATRIYLSMLKGMNEEQVKNYFKKTIPGILNHINADVLGELRTCQQAGYHTILLSGCFDEILNHLQSHLGFDISLGSQLHYHKSGAGLDFSRDIVINSGKNKISSLEAYLVKVDVDWEASKAYGDSYYDYDVLSLVGDPVAVNPDERLLEIAESSNWRIIS